MMMTNEEILSQTLTLAQFHAARAIALAHNHLWAIMTQSWIPLGSVKVGEIENEARRDPGFGMSQYCVPLVDEDGVLRERTSSRRLHWVVDRSGTVTLRVERPFPERTVLSVVLEPKREHDTRAEVLAALCGEAAAYVAAETRSHGTDWEERHLWSIMCAVEALCDDTVCAEVAQKLVVERSCEPPVTDDWWWEVQDRMNLTR